jgi:hypothetical protein
VKTASDVPPPKGGKLPQQKEIVVDDFMEILLFCVILPALLFVFFFSLFSLAEDESNDNKQNKRYELCLKRDMQWVDGNCISK